MTTAHTFSVLMFGVTVYEWIKPEETEKASIYKRTILSRWSISYNHKSLIVFPLLLGNQKTYWTRLKTLVFYKTIYLIVLEH